MGLVACGDEAEEIPTIHLSIWTGENKVSLLQSAVGEFKKLHEKEVNIDFTVSKEGEDTCKDAVLGNPEGAADIYAFADDQLDDLRNAGALLEITDGESVIADVGGEESLAAEAVMRDGKMYAYPETAGNGYFLYYNKKYLTEKDVKTLDGILDVAESKGKKFSMDFGSGWYLYSFFKGAGLTLHANEDGTANSCNWNATADAVGTNTEYSGLDVAIAMQKISGRRGFASLQDKDFLKEVEADHVIAGVNGPWNFKKIKEVWGEDCGVTKLPTYTIRKKQVQMASYIGYKVLGINAYTKSSKWCKAFCEFFINEENQLKEFDIVGELPANQKAASAEKVKAAPVVKALSDQAAYADVQRVLYPFWEASSKYGITIAGGNRDKRKLQKLLDKMVEETIQPIEK